MRILKGIKQGHGIKTPSTDFRPTQSKVRQAFFNTINVEGKRFLDLCAGSGAMGLDALSIGAANVTFVDIERESVRTIFENCKALFPENINYNIKRISASDYAKKTKEKFDVIYTDPPYYSTVYEKVLKTIMERDILSEGGVLTAEMSLDYVKKVSFLKDYDYTEKKYGKTILLYIRKQ